MQLENFAFLLDVLIRKCYESLAENSVNSNTFQIRALNSSPFYRRTNLHEFYTKQALQTNNNWTIQDANNKNLKSNFHTLIQFKKLNFKMYSIRQRKAIRVVLSMRN